VDYLNRISQPGSVMSFSRERRNGSDDPVNDYGWASRGKAREASAPTEGRAFATILARMIDG
jgi:hypothetical protein